VRVAECGPEGKKAAGALRNKRVVDNPETWGVEQLETKLG
jgi:hypothetical protein